jgi:hypothetical protein
LQVRSAERLPYPPQGSEEEENEPDRGERVGEVIQFLTPVLDELVELAAHGLVGGELMDLAVTALSQKSYDLAGF